MCVYVQGGDEAEVQLVCIMCCSLQYYSPCTISHCFTLQVHFSCLKKMK